MGVIDAVIPIVDVIRQLRIQSAFQDVNEAALSASAIGTGRHRTCLERVDVCTCVDRSGSGKLPVLEFIKDVIHVVVGNVMPVHVLHGAKDEITNE